MRGPACRCVTNDISTSSTCIKISMVFFHSNRNLYRNNSPNEESDDPLKNVRILRAIVHPIMNENFSMDLPNFEGDQGTLDKLGPGTNNRDDLHPISSLYISRILFVTLNYSFRWPCAFFFGCCFYFFGCGIVFQYR